jgi:hypothetical protein
MSLFVLSYAQTLLTRTSEMSLIFFICIIVCSDTINKNFGNESYFKFSYGKL